MDTVKGWSKKSIWAKYYQWFFVLEEFEIPNNFCPYFWKSLLMYAFTIPYLIVCLPVIIIEFFDTAFVESIVQRIAMGILMYLFMFVAWALVFVPYFFYVWGNVDAVAFWESLLVMGMLCWLIGIICGGYYLLSFIVSRAQDGIYNVTKNRTSKTNVMVAFVKSKYHKYCPKIEWIEDLEDEE